MPWRVSDIVQQRLRFIEDVARGECGMAELCRQYEISRAAGLSNESLAALRCPNQTVAEIEAVLLELWRAHSRWAAFPGGRYRRRLCSFTDTFRPNRTHNPLPHTCEIPQTILFS